MDKAKTIEEIELLKRKLLSNCTILYYFDSATYESNRVISTPKTFEALDEAIKAIAVNDEDGGNMIKFTKSNVTDKHKTSKYSKLLLNDLYYLLSLADDEDAYLIEYSNNAPRYNNNNDLRRAVQEAIRNNSLPLKVFMINGYVYVRRIG